MNILVVDDMGYFRHNLARILEHHGHEVSMAENGDDALQQLRGNRKFDVVITDLMMRNMDGVELYLQVKAREGADDTGNLNSPPFILLTTAKTGRAGMTGLAENRMRIAKTLGFAKFLFKPLDTDELLKVLSELDSNTSSQVTDLPILLDQLHAATIETVSSGDLKVAQLMLDRLEANIQTLRKFIAMQEQVTAV